MPLIELLTLGLSRMGGFELEHRYLRNERLKLLADVLRRPVASRHVRPIVERREQGGVADVVGAGDIGVEHIHALEQGVVEAWQLGILETTTPVVGHQLIV